MRLQLISRKPKGVSVEFQAIACRTAFSSPENRFRQIRRKVIRQPPAGFFDHTFSDMGSA
jgi:hypothetical protein